MEEDKMISAVATGVMGFAVLMVGLGMTMAFIPQVTYYTCPLCGAQFTSVAELEQHFQTEHPTQPIEIIWE